MCSGVFDIFHVGHLDYLKAAKRLGVHLLVGVTADKHVRKGPGRPVFNQIQRASMLRALRCVDEVIVYDEPIPYDLILKYKPDIYAKGREYEGRLPEQGMVEALGSRVVFIDTPVYSSSELVRKIIKC